MLALRPQKQMVFNSTSLSDQASRYSLPPNNSPGTNFVDVLALFDKDPETDLVVLIGEIGGAMEQEAAQYIKESFSKPVVSFIAGATAPPGKRMGHAGAIITGAAATAEAKNVALKEAGAHVVPSPGAIGATVKSVLGR